ncbi:hypothetical protein Acr_00g0087790 [Actinidia rufa]|uniref:RING-type E3 ubiquitin transferase n=1 Tax=Actinidia rufa TaxID=165716 RepID=A0A7J0DW72_9ERIC|nr:hypothetical protein Acr_00g0087790 [Actinidia rufa]
MDHFFDLDLALTQFSMDHFFDLDLALTMEMEEDSDHRFKSATIAKQIPCGHVYHANCIATWLSLHDSCPLCRCKISGNRKISPAGRST